VHLREHMFGVHVGGRGDRGHGFAVESLQRAVRAHALDADRDGDWIPDALEVAAGLDPAATDSDGDGTADTDEDTDGDGISNGLEWGLVSHPGLVAAAFGPADPRLLGARPDLPGAGAAVEIAGRAARAWNLRSDRTAFYSLPLSEPQKRWAMTRGFRIVLRGQAASGQMFAGLDPLPAGRSYFISLFAGAPGPIVRLHHRTVPRETLDFPLDANVKAPVLMLRYDPERQRAVFAIDHRVRTVDYAGLTQMQEGRGFLWGVTNDRGTAAISEGRFEIAALEIRP
jgi:hypothetical protein